MSKLDNRRESREVVDRLIKLTMTYAADYVSNEDNTHDDKKRPPADPPPPPL
jgi:hypothetical protein